MSQASRGTSSCLLRALVLLVFAVVAVVVVGASLSALPLLLPPESADRHPVSSPRQRLHQLRQLAHDTWSHAYHSYLTHAFPADELLPLSCAGQGHDRTDRDNTGVNDVMGDYLLTVVDSLDTFPILGDHAAFERAVRHVIDHVSFDRDSRVQVFEVTIRMMGGLLAAHLLALEPPPPGTPVNGSTFTSSIRGFSLPWYRSELLELAHDLGKRLLPAFDTPTGIPFARVHLQTGLRGKNAKLEPGETCAAGAGSLLLEFITLSRLTGDPSFEHVARRAFFAVWNRRSDIGLLGNTIDARTGLWLHGVAGTGAGIDSFYEYAAKAHVLTGEEDYHRVWEEGHAALLRYVRSPDGFSYRPVHMHTGQLASPYIDSLAAFLPGVQVLMGDLDSATRAHALYAFIWARYSGLPELFDTHARRGAGVHLGYPLRPEFIESNMYLYQATGDEWYLSIAERVLHDLNARSRVECGFAAIKDLRTGELEDKMPSFVTGETLKYLYLTFAEDSPFLRDDSAFVFTTEGHPLEIPRTHPPPKPSRRSRALGQRSNRSSPLRGSSASAAAPRDRFAAAPTCVAYDPLSDERHAHFLALGMNRRIDWEHARWLAGHEPNDAEAQNLIDVGTWSHDGWCEVPFNEDASSIELVFAAASSPSPSPSPSSASAAMQAAGGGGGGGGDEEEAVNPLLLFPSPAQLSPHSSGNGDLVVHSLAGLRFSLERMSSAAAAAAPPGPDSSARAAHPRSGRGGGSSTVGGGSPRRYAVTRVGGVPVPAGKSVVIRDETVLAGLPPRRLERLRLRAEVGVGPREEAPHGDAEKGGQGRRGVATEEQEADEAGRSAEAMEDGKAGRAPEAAPSPGTEPIPHPPDPALVLPALAASFGPSPTDPGVKFALDGPALPLVLPLSSDPASPFGCVAAAPPPPESQRPYLLLLHRGECSFARKAHLAARAGAAGVVLVSGPSSSEDDDHVGQAGSAADPTTHRGDGGEGETDHDVDDADADAASEGFIVPGAAAEEEDEETMRQLVPLVLVGQSAGMELERLVRRACHDPEGTDPTQEARGGGGVGGVRDVYVRAERDKAEPVRDEEDTEVAGLYVLGGYLTTNLKLCYPGTRSGGGSEAGGGGGGGGGSKT